MPAAEYLKFAQQRKEFWEQHADCYIFGKEAKFPVSINQCFPAHEEYIIRKLEKHMLETCKNKLLQLADIKQRQVVCLTPVDNDMKLLKKPPAKWEDIQLGKFMIIDGQHSITASKELQRGQCDEKRREELRTWDAYIVWTLDPLKLHNISKFYNTTNHLEHAQPTWGNQIISGRLIWTHFERPTMNGAEARIRGNKAIQAPHKWQVYTITLYDKLSSTRG